MQLTTTFVRRAVASAVLLFLAAPSHAQGPIAAGQGLLFNSGATQGSAGIREFAFNVIQTARGTRGMARIVQVNGLQVFFNVTSYDFDGAGNLIIAGPITKIKNPGSSAPPPPFLGFTAITSVQDNGGASPDAITLVQAIPPAFGSTLTDFYAFLAANTPPGFPTGPAGLYAAGFLQSVYQPIDAGNIVIF